MQALPDYLNINDPASNLAGFGATPGYTPAIAPLLNPDRPPYYAYDGTYIGSGNTCDPISDEPYLSGLLVPDILEENRLEWGQEYALPVLVGAAEFAKSGRALPAALWALGAFMAPMVVAGWIGFNIVRSVPAIDAPR